jgi:hypothetical protein
MGHIYDEPVLILKACIGNRSLGWDLLPPGSQRFEFEGKTYAGYHYNHHAETYMEVGDALGRAMAELLEAK